MGAISPIHILIVLIVLIVLFGATRLPKLGKDLGEGMRGFKDGLTGKDDEKAKELEKPAVTQIESDAEQKPAAPAGKPQS